MSTRPFFITDIDYKLLKKKYSDKELEKVLKKIENGYPVQYAIGDVEFLDNTILVNENVLIPRFETELLVSKLFNLLENKSNLDILDLCTGSGCISIALKSKLNATIDACDISKKAIDMASKNALLNNTEINFFQKDILKDFKFDKKYDVIVSNPPYVSLEEQVDKAVKFEPQIALYPGKDDIVFYKTILKGSKKILNENGIIAFEIGYNQGERIKNVALKYFPNAKIIIEKDYNNYNRFIFIFTE